MIQVAQIGCGYWGPNLLRNLVRLPEFEVVAVVEKSADRRAYVHSNYPDLSVIDDDDLLLDEMMNVDAVAVATPASTHFPLAQKFLEHGKHVFVEKPLALRAQECQVLIDLAEEKAVTLMVGHVFEYNAAVNQIKGLISTGELGDIYYITSERLNLGVIRQDVNALWNLAPHDISIINYWLGEEPESTSAQGMAYIQEDIEDVAFLVMHYPSGVAAHVHVSWLHPLKVRRMIVVGSKKMLVYDDTSADARIQIYDKGITRQSIDTSLGEFDTFAKFQLIHRAGDVLIPHLEYPEPIVMEMKDFARAIQNHSKPIADGYSGLRVVRVLEAAQESLDNCGAIIRIGKDGAIQ